MSKVVDSVKNLITPILEKVGIEIFNITYQKENTGMTLTIYIDKEEGVTLSDCELVNELIDEPLDALDPTNGKAYTLNVSSPGADRPLLREIDYIRNINKKVDISTYAPLLNKKTKATAKLLSFNDESITIEIDKKQYILERKAIANIKQAIDF